jgi:hypothetical protein
MTHDQIINALKTGPQEIDDATIAAVIEHLQTNNIQGLFIRYLSSERLHQLSLRLIKEPAYLALTEKWASEKGPSTCDDNTGGDHCPHIEDVAFEEGGETEKEAVCCFCGLFLMPDSEVDPSKTTHGIYTGEPSRDDLIKAKNRMIMEGRLYIQTERHGYAVQQLTKASYIEEDLAETAGTDPNGPRREDHLRSAASCRALAEVKI